MHRTLLILLAAALLLGACGRAGPAAAPSATPSAAPTPDPTTVAPSQLALDLQAAERRWKTANIASYRLTILEVHSIWSAQRISVTVTDGQVSDVSNMCIPAPAQGQTCTPQPIDPPTYTVPGLLSQARDLLAAHPPEYLKLSFDGRLGYPTQFDYNDPQIVDEDYGLTVERFEQLPGKPASEVGEMLTLGVGESGSAGGLALTLVRVVEDSRCPASVTCAWAGQIILELEVAADGQAPQRVELTQMGVGRPSEQGVAVGGRRLLLVSVTPYPPTPDDIPADRYRATLLVSPATP